MYVSVAEALTSQVPVNTPGKFDPRFIQVCDHDGRRSQYQHWLRHGCIWESGFICTMDQEVLLVEHLHLFLLIRLKWSNAEVSGGRSILFSVAVALSSIMLTT